MHPLLNLTLSARAALVTVDTACSVLGVDSESISAMVDSGELIWVWDVSARQNTIRELRIWSTELADRTAARRPEREVLSAILPTRRDQFRAAEVAMTLRVSDPHLLRLIRLGTLSGPAIGHTQWITRASLSAFLTTRLVGKG